MDATQHSNIVSFIWGIADDVLRDLYVRGKYRDVILPMTVLRRLDAVLEPTKDAVLDMKSALDKAKVDNQDAPLRQAAGQAFYNTSKFTLKALRNRASQQKLKADFEAYLDGFSPNVQEILENFEFRNQVPRLSKADALIDLLREYRTRLIADVVTGKLDVREAAASLPDETDTDEPDLDETDDTLAEDAEGTDNEEAAE